MDKDDYLTAEADLAALLIKAVADAQDPADRDAFFRITELVRSISTIADTRRSMGFL